MVASKHTSKRFIIELCRAVDILNTSEDNKNHFIYFNNYEASTSSSPGYVSRILRIPIRQGMVRVQRGQRGPIIIIIIIIINNLPTKKREQKMDLVS